MNIMPNYEKKILIIDDDARILDLLAQILANNEFTVQTAANTQCARKILKDEKFHVILIDYMMPNENGIDFVSWLRKQGDNCTIIMITAINSVDNKILGFNNGIDEYITKPFDPKELIARLNRIFNKMTINIINFANYSFNLTTNKLQQNGQNIYISSTEAALLHEFCRNINKPLPRSELAKKMGVMVSERTVDVQIARLRRKLGENIIQTERHVGYVLKD